MKDTRQLLKETREAIKNKDYALALNLSKSILRQDKTNYMALVFYGVSLQEIGPIEEVPKVFKKAIDSNATNPLAWNGLINYYEKVNNKDEIKKDLIKCYLSVLNLETNDKKVLEYCEKLPKLIEFSQIAETAKTMYSCWNKFENLQAELSEIIVGLCEKYIEKLPNIETIFEECLLYIINNKPPSIHYYSLYIKLLYSKKSYEELLKNTEKMHALFETDQTPLNWICKVYNELFVDKHELAEKYYKACDYYHQLLEADPKNGIALFTKAIVLFKMNKLLEARDIMIDVTTLRPGLLHAWLFLMVIYGSLHLYDDAIQAASRADKLLKSFGGRGKTALAEDVYLEYLSKSSTVQNWENVLKLYEEMDDESLKNKCLKSVILANVNLERFEVANSLISKLEERDAKLLLAKYYSKQKQYQNALDLLQQNVEDASDYWTEIGILYCNLGDYNKSLISLLKAAKQNQNNYVTYLYLGHCYQKMEQIEKAKRCYEKAFKINSKSKEIGMELNKLYRKEKNWEASQNVLKTFEGDQTSSWTYLNLGLSYLEQGDYIKAVDNLQKAVRVERDNPKYCWEALADAYLARGSYVSALKCYGICLELSENKLYPSLQIANIKKILGEYNNARADFEELLLAHDQYVPVLKGLAETCMLQAKECYEFQRLGRSRDHAQTAADKLTLAIREKGNYSCLWKLFGDVCVFVAKLPEKYCCLFMYNDFVKDDGNKEKSIVEQTGLYELAVKFYCKAITLLKDNNILIWHDLGACYLDQALITANENKKGILLSYAMAAANHCISTQPDKWEHWNLMGNVAVRQEPPNYALAQHAFIKAVTLDKNSAVSWSNLGVLYLILDDLKLANKAFSQGQRSDPNYVNSWIGQAMVAEKIAEEEAMDLLRHSTQLGQHQQGSLGYGYWVCKILKESPVGSPALNYINKMHSIPVACDVLTWYTEKNPLNPCAWNMLGFLRERLGLKQLTLEAYKKAYQLSSKEHKDIARINYGRALLKLERYKEAINVFQETKEATFSSGTGLALALFRDGQYEGSYSAYEQVLHWLTEQQNYQSDLLVALASIAYMFQGIDPAKTLLFQSIQLKPTSPWSLFTTLALALIHRDMKLAELILGEMDTIKNDRTCLAHYSTLLSYTHLIQRDPKKAISEVSKLVHKFPESPSVWLTLCNLLLVAVEQRKSSLAPLKCAKAVMLLGRSNIDVTKVLSLASLALVIYEQPNLAKNLAQKAVHSYPNVADGWAVLAFSLIHDKVTKYPCKKILDIFNHIKKLNPEYELVEWTQRQEILVR